MQNALKIIGAVSRYTLAAVALMSFGQFFTLIGVSTQRAQELAGETLVRALLCGVVAAIWFYRAPKRDSIENALMRTQETKPQSPLEVAPQPGANITMGASGVFCTKCGSKNPDDAGFCYKCGKPIFVPDSNSPTMTDGQEPIPATHELAPEEPRDRKSWQATAIALGVARTDHAVRR
jgi:hypothetical protein